MKKLALFVLLTSLAAGAYAQAPAVPAAPGAAPAATPAAPPAKPVSMADKKLIKDLSDVVLVDQAYLKVLVDSKVSLGQSLDSDMKKSDGNLKRMWTALASLGTAKKAELATEISKSDLAKVQKLSKEKPDKFQKEFFKDFSKETAKSVKLLDGAKSIQDPELKIFIEDWTGTVKGVNLFAESGERAATAKK